MVKLVASLNALGPISVTLAGMVMEVKLDALRNALSPMMLREESASNITEAKFDA